MTHDLFKSFATSFSIEVKEILIYNLLEGIFYAKIICEKDGVTTEIDARTSDAIAIAVRFNAPVYTFENILSSAGILLDGEALEKEMEMMDEEEEVSEIKPEEASVEELENQLAIAIEEEDYELASKLRDLINKKTS